MPNYKQENQEYIEQLFGENGAKARKYLQDRYINVATAKAWELGFSPKHFIPNCYKNTGEEFYKKMNGRITIPVYNSNGILIGISGRSIYDDLKPKYMHYVFPTRSTLFGLWKNEKDIIRENAIVFTEGQFDVITAWQNGLRICACTFGAHFSETQYAIASRYTNRINIMYDQDDAGVIGTKTSIEKNSTYSEIKVKNIQYLMRRGEDLDSWIKKDGSVKKVIKAINCSKLDFLENAVNKLQ